MAHGLKKLSDTPACFIPVANILTSDKEAPVKSLELCLACEQVSGTHSIEGAQKINGLWRIYPLSKEARAKLLIQGISIRGQSITVMSNNPFIVDGSGDLPTTRLTIGNLPISVSQAEVDDALGSLGVQKRSPIRFECLRDQDGGLTRFKSGRRFVYINVPPSPLPPSILIGNWRVFLFHQEQKSDNSRGTLEAPAQTAEPAISVPTTGVEEHPGTLPSTSDSPQPTNQTPGSTQQMGGESLSNTRQAKMNEFIKRSRSLSRGTASNRSSSLRSKRNLSGETDIPGGKAPRAEASHPPSVHPQQEDWFDCPAGVEVKG